MVYQVVDMPAAAKGDSSYYHGYSIQMKVDIRWAMFDTESEPYSCRVWKEDALLLRMPAFPFTPLYNREEIIRTGKVAQNVRDAMDNANHRFLDNLKQRKWKYLLLQFPPGHELSSQVIFDEAGDKEELDYEAVEVEYQTEDGLEKTEDWIHFQVARIDIPPTKKGKVDKKKKTSKFASKVAPANAFAKGTKMES